VNYRTPKPAMALAAALLPPTMEPPLSVRDSSESPWYATDDESLAELVRRENELIGDGRVAVIAPPARVVESAATLGLSPGPDLDAPVAVLTSEQSKGLEFDSVIIVDPAGIEQASPRGRADLYVALTRTTRRLGLVSPGEIPKAAGIPDWGQSLNECSKFSLPAIDGNKSSRQGFLKHVHDAVTPREHL